MTTEQTPSGDERCVLWMKDPGKSLYVHVNHLANMTVAKQTQRKINLLASSEP